MRALTTVQVNASYAGELELPHENRRARQVTWSKQAEMRQKHPVERYNIIFEEEKSGIASPYSAYRSPDIGALRRLQLSVAVAKGSGHPTAQCALHRYRRLATETLFTGGVMTTAGFLIR